MNKLERKAFIFGMIFALSNMISEGNNFQEEQKDIVHYN